MNLPGGDEKGVKCGSVAMDALLAAAIAQAKSVAAYAAYTSSTRGPEPLLRLLRSHREYSETLLAAGSALRRYCDHFEPIVDAIKDEDAT